MTTTQASPVLTIPEVARYLRVSERTVERRIADGSLRAAKIGGLWRIEGSELARLLTAGRRDEVETR